MLTIITSAVGVAAIVGYFYTAVMFGRMSYKTHKSWSRIVMDAITWPVMGWKAIEDLYDV